MRYQLYLHTFRSFTSFQVLQYGESCFHWPMATGNHPSTSKRQVTSKERAIFHPCNSNMCPKIRGVW